MFTNILLKKPTIIPFEVIIFINTSVMNMRYVSETEEEIRLTVHFSSRKLLFACRRLAYSYEPEPILKFPYTSVGTINFQDRDVYLFLEKE